MFIVRNIDNGWYLWSTGTTFLSYMECEREKDATEFAWRSLAQQVAKQAAAESGHRYEVLDKAH